MCDSAIGVGVSMYVASQSAELQWEEEEGAYLELGERDDVTVLGPMPHCTLTCGIVVVEPGGVCVKQLPPLVVICLLSVVNKRHQHKL